MRVFFDIFSNDELISDSYPIAFEHNDVIMCVPSRLVAKGGEDIDIGRGNEFGGGGDDEAVDPNVERVNEIINGFSLQETSFTKKEYAAIIKAYMQKLKKHLEANGSPRVGAFMEGATAFAKWAMANFNDLKFYTGPSYDQTAMIVVEWYKNPTDEAPHFLYIRDGLREEKY